MCSVLRLQRLRQFFCSGVPPHLIGKSARRQPACLYLTPAQLAHQFRQPACSGSIPAPLRHFKKVKQRLRADALDAVVADFAERP
jgi:hypothetical protein